MISGSRLETPELTETAIANLFGYAYSVLFGKARSGLTALLELYCESEPLPFLMPSNVCSSVLAAALKANATPVLVDISRDTGVPTDQNLLEEMKNAQRPGILMITHLYGFADQYSRCRSFADKTGWFILENDTAATKARLNGQMSKTAIGDALLVSFGPGKVIDGGAGGALLTDDKSLMLNVKKRRNSYQLLNNAAKNTEIQLTKLRRLLNQGLPNGCSLTAHYESFLPYELNETSYRLPESFLPAINRSIERFPQICERRHKSAQQWLTVLLTIGKGIVLPDSVPDTPWRFIARIPQGRNPVVTALRTNGIDVGTNYPPLQDYFPLTINAPARRGARTWGNQVINLWVTDEYDSVRKEKVANIISETLSKVG